MTEHDPVDYDVLIIGAGINGAGLFRDLCEQGLRCLIVDKGDYGSGTSAAPSRLIHGGLKYLETGELRLVAESTYERNLLLRNAPHTVAPLPTVIPAFSWTKGIGPALRTLFGSTTAPRSRGALLLKIGLGMYDFYGSRSRVMPRHGMMGRARALRELPALTPDIVALGTYYDAVITAPERLVLELIQDGVAASEGSQGLNWTTLQNQENGVVTLTGPTNETMTVRPKIVVNAAGPWIDKVNVRLGAKTDLIGGTKGSHILLDHPELIEQLKGRMIYFEGNDGRILLVFPFLGKALVGSTDIPADDPDTTVCDTDEITYFMNALRDLLPGLTFDEDQILYSYSGIRPLPNSQGTAPGLISRDHSCPIEDAQGDRPFPILSLVGGKWTTFRAFAQDVTDQILHRLERTRETSTSSLPIGGGRGFPTTEDAKDALVNSIATSAGGTVSRVRVLLDRYGTTARAIALHEGPNPILLPTTAEISEAEIEWIVRNEQVHHLQDIILRRTQLAITGDISAGAVECISQIAARCLNWDKPRQQAEVVDLEQLLANRHGKGTTLAKTNYPNSPLRIHNRLKVADP